MILSTLATIGALLSPVTPTPFNSDTISPIVSEAQIIADAQGRAEAKHLDHEIMKGLGMLLPSNCTGCGGTESFDPGTQVETDYKYVNIYCWNNEWAKIKVKAYMEVYTGTVDSTDCTDSTSCGSKSCSVDYDVAARAFAIKVSGAGTPSIADMDAACVAAGFWVDYDGTTKDLTVSQQWEHIYDTVEASCGLIGGVDKTSSIQAVPLAPVEITFTFVCSTCTAGA
jgi:hypothetical protein